MNICLKCGKYPFCRGIEENKKECDKFIKRKLGGEDEQRDKVQRKKHNGQFLWRMATFFWNKIRR